jgi:hypothetical protein
LQPLTIRIAVTKLLLEEIPIEVYDQRSRNYAQAPPGAFFFYGVRRISATFDQLDPQQAAGESPANINVPASHTKHATCALPKTVAAQVPVNE